MRRPHVAALVAGGLGLAAAAWGVIGGDGAPEGLLPVAAGFAPVAVLLAVWGRLGGRLPVAALAAGALLAPIIAVAGHAIVAGFMAAFAEGYADSGRRLVESLHADPRLTTALASPWVIVLLVDLAVVAPLVEEVAKATAAVVAGPAGRRDAFLFGVAAGTGFAVIENLLYAGLAWRFGSIWPVIALTRSMGAAVHPLAAGLVMLGWWEWRHTGRRRALLLGYLAGAGLHALWNGSIVVLGVVESVLSAGGTPSQALKPLALTWAAMFGVAVAGLLAAVTVNVARDHPPLRGFLPGEGRLVAGWTVMSAGLLVPVAVLALAFPAFYRG